jgi:hypothetical protein
MLYFYRKNEPIPIYLFYPRWLINRPAVLYKPWQIRLDNIDYTRDNIYIEEQGARDRSRRSSKQLIIDTTLLIAEKHKNLPLGEKETFALAFKKMNDNLAQR